MHHRRVTADRSHLYRGEHRFREDGYTTYVFLSWQAYAEKIPEAGTVWDFENAHWGRAGSSTWNGLESIHGRSTWGALVFDIPELASGEIIESVGALQLVIALVVSGGHSALVRVGGRVAAVRSTTPPGASPIDDSLLADLATRLAG